MIEMAAKASAPLPSFRNRITGSGTSDPAKLVDNTKNWRKHPNTQEAGLIEVLKSVGWARTRNTRR